MWLQRHRDSVLWKLNDFLLLPGHTSRQCEGAASLSSSHSHICVTLITDPLDSCMIALLIKHLNVMWFMIICFHLSQLHMQATKQLVGWFLKTLRCSVSLSIMIQPNKLIYLNFQHLSSKYFPINVKYLIFIMWFQIFSLWRVCVQIRCGRSRWTRGGSRSITAAAFIASLQRDAWQHKPALTHTSVSVCVCLLLCCSASFPA